MKKSYRPVTSTPPAAKPRSQAPLQPHHPGQTVLLAVTGMSPAVLTETVWALAKERPKVIPDRVVVVTTISGRQAIERELLSEEAGASVWQQLRRSLLGPASDQIHQLILEPAHLIVAPNPRTGRGDWLEDIRTPGENRAAANFLLEEVRRFAESPDTRLIASVAGGRKTMGALLYACLSLLGRETDRLTHVLVNDPFDAALKPKFFFPEQSTQELVTSGGQTVLANSARIDLADVPFVPLRNLFERDLVKRPCSFDELVNRCRRQVAQLARRDISLTLSRCRRRIEINGVSLELSVLQHLLMLFLSESAAGGQPPLTKYSNALAPLGEFAERLYQQRRLNDFSDWRHDARLPKDFDEQRLRKLLDELKKKFRSHPDSAALLLSLPAKGRFSLDLRPAAIRLLE